MGRRRGRPRSVKRKIPRVPPRFLIGLVLVVLIGAAAGYAFKQIFLFSFFTVKEVTVRGDDVHAGIRAVIADKVLGKSLLSVNAADIRKSVMDRYPRLQELTILKEFPDRINATFILSRPFLQIKGDRYYILNEELKVIGTERAPVPELIVVETDTLTADVGRGSEVSDERIRKSAELIRELEDSELFMPTTVLAHRTDTISFFTHGTKVILGSDGFAKKIKILETLMNKNYNNDFSTLRYIDLRYSKVYIGKR